jgi:hypothetical protein
MFSMNQLSFIACLVLLAGLVSAKDVPSSSASHGLRRLSKGKGKGKGVVSKAGGKMSGGGKMGSSKYGGKKGGKKGGSYYKGGKKGGSYYKGGKASYYGT